MGSFARKVMRNSLFLCFIVGFLTPFVWGIGQFVFDNSSTYGTIYMPGSAVLHFPKGEVDIFYGAYVGESCCDANNQDEANDLGIPDDLSVSAVPVHGGLVPGMETSYGSQISDNGNAHERVAKMDVPVAGAYRVSVSGGVGAQDERVQFGQPNSAGIFLVIGASLFLGLALLSLGARLVARGADGRGSHVGDEARVGFGFMTGSVALIAAIALPVVLISHKSLSIKPSGTVSANGQPLQAKPLLASQTSETVAVTSSSSATTVTNATTAQASSTPASARVIAATSPQSLFRARNFTSVLGDLTKALGARMNVVDMMLYPGAATLEVEQNDGNSHLVVIQPDGSISQTTPRPITGNTQVIYLSQVSGGVPALLLHELGTRFHVREAQIASIDLVTTLPGQNAGWRISLTGSRTSYLAYLDGTDLHRLPAGSAA